jgi:uncharacterized membrane protein
MSTDKSTAIALLGMILATFGCRAGGYFLLRRMPPSAWLRDALSYVPGALFIGYVVPGIVAGGVGVWVGAAATVLTMILSHSFAAAMVVGTAVVWGISAWL